MSNANVTNLFQTALDDGAISAAALQGIHVPDLGAQIQAGLGMPVAQVGAAGGVMLFGMMPDDSGSIASIRKDPNNYRSSVIGPQLVRDGHNMVLDALKGTKQRDGIMILTRYLNGFVLNPYTLVDQAIRMDDKNYDPRLGTPLYDQAVVFLLTVLKKAQEFIDSGVSCRTVSVFLTDGRDEHSKKQTADDVRRIVEDMIRSENHIVGFMGIDDGSVNAPNFSVIAQEMGIPPGLILTPGNTEHEIRAAFNTVTQSALRASQGGKGFSALALGGFGA